MNGTLTTPEWLKNRGGELQLGNDKRTWYVILDQQPLYRLAVAPAKDKLGCTMMQTNNGRRIECPAVVATAEDAIRAGLEELRRTLGW